MTSTTTESNLLEQDSRGRVRVSAERREALLDEYAKSGLSGARFARLAGVCYSTFAGWRSKRQKRGTAKRAAADVASRPTDGNIPPQSPIRLLEASVESDSSEGFGGVAASVGLTVELAGGARIRPPGRDSAHLDHRIAGRVEAGGG